MSPADESSSENPTNDTKPTAKRSSIAGLAVWDFGGRLASFGVLFVVSVLLTRLLSPAEFGAFAVVLAIIAFSSIFIDLGFRSAIVQRQDTSKEQLSTVFFLNVAIGILLFAGLFLVSGVIEQFYAINGLESYIKAASAIFVLNSLSLVPGGLLQKELRLKALSVITTIAAAISGTIAILMAVYGFGVWSLVTQQLILAAITCFGSFAASKWRPSFLIDPRSIIPLWSYGIKLFLAGLSDSVFTRLDVFIIGKLFPVQTLGFYNRAQSLDNLIKNFAASTTTSVAFPVIARMADELENVKSFYLRCLNVISFLSFLLIGVLFLTCFDIVIILFTEKWIDVGYYFRIMALTAFVYPASALMVNLIAARGNSGAFLKLEILKKAVLFPAYLSFFFGGVMVFLIMLGFVYLLALALNAEFIRREIGIPIGEQLWAIATYSLPGLVAGFSGYGAGLFIDNIYLHFAVASVVFSAIYLAICYKFSLPGMLEVTDRLRSLRNA
ncbi:MAG: lipopolysaccharide biosynthesis protein [Acidobacteria bacterium]|nr:lipopolysaccharide biosynthesis protein [Acidobacteriota bacterium]